jgi:hypothetical protein
MRTKEAGRDVICCRHAVGDINNEKSARRLEEEAKAQSWCVPKEAMVDALLRAVCTDVRDQVKNLSIESCEGGFQ